MSFWPLRGGTGAAPAAAAAATSRNEEDEAKATNHPERNQESGIWDHGIHS